MRNRTDLLIAGVVVALAAAAVAGQLTAGAEKVPDGTVRVLEVGEAVSPDVTLLDLDGSLARLGDRLGPHATVLYSWSSVCRCIPVCDRSLGPRMERFGPEAGVRWIAIAGEPNDDLETVEATLERLDARYAVLRDPTHRLCGPLGFDRASMVVVLDADGYVRFRGNPTDDLVHPTRVYLDDVLPAVIAGRRSPLAETGIRYGCAFSEPLPDCPDSDLAARAAP